MRMTITQSDRTEAKKVVDRFNVDKSLEEIFYDLCFAIMAPQTTFKSNIKTVGVLKQLNFYKKDIDESLLQDIVRATRFFRMKASRLIKAKRQFLDILKIVTSDEDSISKRNQLVKMVNGVGMKAGSHFLRNLGHKDLAIIDTHVLKYMKRDAPKNAKEYLKVEEEFTKKARKLNMAAAELDVVVWKKYSNTPWEKFIH